MDYNNTTVQEVIAIKPDDIPAAELSVIASSPLSGRIIISGELGLPWAGMSQCITIFPNPISLDFIKGLGVSVCSLFSVHQKLTLGLACLQMMISDLTFR